PMADAALLLDRQPAFQRRAQVLYAYRLRQIGIHAGCEAALFLALYGVGSDRNDRRADTPRSASAARSRRANSWPSMCGMWMSASTAYRDCLLLVRFWGEADMTRPPLAY